MLVLSRRVGEAVCVGPGVTIRVMETKGDRVRLAFDAPKEVRVMRAELKVFEPSPSMTASPSTMPFPIAGSSHEAQLSSRDRLALH